MMGKSLSSVVKGVSSVYGADHSKLGYIYWRKSISSLAVELTKGIGYDSPAQFTERC